VPDDLKTPDQDLLDLTLAAAAKDQQMVTEQGLPTAPVPEGMTFREVPTHVDERGSVFEVYDPRWNWHPEPMVFSYCFTVRPGMVKGWGLHKEHDDRYLLLTGEMQLVTFDVRKDSSTYGMVSKISLSHFNRRLVRIPAFVWHADFNIGTTDAMVINFPTIQYNHAAPDKYRLPWDTDLIPHVFHGAQGGG